ncbi:tetratricopeptide repeat protein [Clostridium yunnanense]|nr:tetratricopeptide repeat protein [Clostridium yunnanense]
MRKRFHMNQMELEDTKMTRAFISMMESGKRKVSRSSSKLLALKFNNKAKELGLELGLDDEYFSRKPYEDAKIYCDNELLKENDHEQLEELLNIALEFKLDYITAKVYIKQGDRYLYELEYKTAFVSYVNALGKLKELKENGEQSYVYNKIGLCKINIKEYEEAVFYLNQAINYANEGKDDNSFTEASYNLALAYSYMLDHEKSVEILDKFILNSSVFEKIDFNFRMNIKVLKAKEIYNSGRREKAVEQYISIIEELQDKNDFILSNVYSLLGDYYFEISNLHESLKYINSAQRLKGKLDKKSLPNTLKTKAKIFFKQGLSDESIMILELAMNISEELSDFNMIISIYNELIKIYKEIKDVDRIRETSKNLIELLDKNNLEQGKDIALCNLMEVAINQGDSEPTNQILSKLNILLGR